MTMVGKQSDSPADACGGGLVGSVLPADNAAHPHLSRGFRQSPRADKHVLSRFPDKPAWYSYIA